MARKSGPPPIVYIVIVLVLLGGGYWLFSHHSDNQSANNPPSNQPTASPDSNPPPTPPTSSSAASTPFPAPTSVPSGTNVRIVGSTTMVQINQSLKQGFEGKFPGTTVATSAGGSDQGIRALLAGSADVAAVSRPLTAQEQSQGLVAVPVTTDAIAVVVGKANPFDKGLTSAQVASIFEGQVNTWSAVGGTAATIRVINRPAGSGTHQVFQTLVLKGANFGTTPNITTLQRDATTPLLQALGTDGIGYATYAQVVKQTTVRVLAIDGVTPEAANYPYQRSLYYVYKQNPSSAVQAFLGYANSPQGQQALAVGG